MCILNCFTLYYVMSKCVNRTLITCEQYPQCDVSRDTPYASFLPGRERGFVECRGNLFVLFVLFKLLSHPMT